MGWKIYLLMICKRFLVPHTLTSQYLRGCLTDSDTDFNPAKWITFRIGFLSSIQSLNNLPLTDNGDMGKFDSIKQALSGNAATVDPDYAQTPQDPKSTSLTNRLLDCENNCCLFIQYVYLTINCCENFLELN